MTRPDVIKALVALSCYLILSLSILRNHAAELVLQQSQSLEHTHQRVAKRKRENDDDMAAICLIVPELVAGFGYKFQ